MKNNIIENIKKGKNIDLYLAILCSVVLISVGFLGISLSSTISQNILIFILTLISVSLLNSRDDQEKIRDILSQKSNTTIFAPKLEFDFEDRISRAKEIVFYGISLNQKLFQHHDAIEKILEKNAMVKIVLLKPGTTSTEISVMRGKHIDIKTQNERILYSMKIVEDLQRKFPDRFSLYLTEFLPSYETYIFDPTESYGTIALRFYGYKTTLGSEPYININTSNHFFKFFVDEINNVVKDAEKVG